MKVDNRLTSLMITVAGAKPWHPACKREHKYAVSFNKTMRVHDILSLFYIVTNLQ